MNTKLMKNNRNPETNSFRLATARTAKELAERPRAQVVVLYAELKYDHVQVDFVTGACNQRHEKISLQNLEKHVRETYHSSRVMSDVTAYYYIEENLEAVCTSYLEAGKEVEAL